MNKNIYMITFQNMSQNVVDAMLMKLSGLSQLISSQKLSKIKKSHPEMLKSHPEMLKSNPEMLKSLENEKNYRESLL